MNEVAELAPRDIIALRDQFALVRLNPEYAISGQHDARFTRYVWANAEESKSFFDEKLLDLPSLDAIRFQIASIIFNAADNTMRIYFCDDGNGTMTVDHRNFPQEGSFALMKKA